MTKINAKEAIERIRKLLFSDNAEPSPTETPEPVSYNLKDGTTINVFGALEPGTSVTCAGQNGEEPAPDGELELSDGTCISITGGLITEVETAQEEAAEQDGGATPDETQFHAVPQITEKLARIEQEIALIKTGFSRQDSVQKELLDLVSSLAVQPAEEPVAKPKNMFSETKSRQEVKMKSLVDTLQKMKSFN